MKKKKKNKKDEALVEKDVKKNKKKEVGKNVPAHKLPYPKVQSKKDLEKHFKRFLDIFKKLEINIPFAEALDQMPTYAKFMKEILSKKCDTMTMKQFNSTQIIVQSSKEGYQGKKEVPKELHYRWQLVPSMSVKL
jgi:hypothetical protein